MKRYIALLRGVNVGGNRALPMAELRARLLELGYADVRTLLASGNLVLAVPEVQTAVLEARLEADLYSALGLETSVMVRDSAEWTQILGANPYPEEARTDPSHLLVVVLKAQPSPAAIQKLADEHKGPERISVQGREAYVYYPAGIGDSKLSLKILGPGTGRNWNTVLKLQGMLTG